MLQKIQKALTIPLVLLALFPTFASADVTMDEIQAARAQLDPIVLQIPGVTGSMIGLCRPGSDEDPFADRDVPVEGPFETCLVYFVETEELIPSVKNEYQNLGLKTAVPVRFQLTFPPMGNQ